MAKAVLCHSFYNISLSSTLKEDYRKNLQSHGFTNPKFRNSTNPRIRKSDIP